MKITLEEFFESKEYLAIHCDTKEKANKLLIEFDKLGKKWESKESYLDFNPYASYNDRTCYSNKGEYCSVECYKNIDYKVYSFEDIIFEEPKPKNLIPEIAKMLGVEIGEEFTVNQNKKQYAFDDREGLMEKVYKYIWEEPVDGVINSLLLGEYTIQKLPQKPVLTNVERTILENLPKEYKWICRNQNNNLILVTKEPFKVSNENSCWNCRNKDNGENTLLRIQAFNHLFQFIKWEDEKPWNIEELLKGE